MRNAVLFIVACLLALCAGVAGAQTTVAFMSGSAQDQQTVFSSQNVSHGAIRITTGAEKFPIPPLTFKVRECSNWPAAAVPFYMFTLTKGSTVYQGMESWVDQERVVTFATGGIQAPNTTTTYSLHSDVVEYPGSHPLDKHCFRMTLERSGVPLPISGNFPIRFSAKTLVRSKPVVSITTIGATTGRVRTAVDDVFRITIAAGTSYEILVKELSLRFAGATLPSGGSGLYQIINDTSGIVLGFGDLQGGNVVLTGSGETYIDAGTSWSLRIRVNSSEFQNSPNFQDALSVQIVHPCDFQWDTEAGNEGGPGLCLEPQVVPNTATVSYE